MFYLFFTEQLFLGSSRRGVLHHHLCNSLLAKFTCLASISLEHFLNSTIPWHSLTPTRYEPHGHPKSTSFRILNWHLTFRFYHAQWFSLSSSTTSSLWQQRVSFQGRCILNLTGRLIHHDHNLRLAFLPLLCYSSNRLLIPKKLWLLPDSFNTFHFNRAHTIIS